MRRQRAGDARKQPCAVACTHRQIGAVLTRRDLPVGRQRLRIEPPRQPQVAGNLRRLIGTLIAVGHHRKVALDAARREFRRQLAYHLLLEQGAAVAAEPRAILFDEVGAGARVKLPQQRRFPVRPDARPDAADVAVGQQQQLAQVVQAADPGDEAFD